MKTYNIRTGCEIWDATVYSLGNILHFSEVDNLTFAHLGLGVGDGGIRSTVMHFSLRARLEVTLPASSCKAVQFSRKCFSLKIAGARGGLARKLEIKETYKLSISTLPPE